VGWGKAAARTFLPGLIHADHIGPAFRSAKLGSQDPPYRWIRIRGIICDSRRKSGPRKLRRWVSDATASFPYGRNAKKRRRRGKEAYSRGEEKIEKASTRSVIRNQRCAHRQVLMCLFPRNLRQAEADQMPCARYSMPMSRVQAVAEVFVR